MPSFLARLVNWLSWRHGLRLLCVFRREIAQAPTVAAPPGASFRALTARELREAARDPGMDLRPAFVEEALRRGDVAVGVFMGGELAGYTWLAHDAAPDVDGVWVQAPRDATYRYKTFVHQRFRGRGLAVPLLRQADAAAPAMHRAAAMSYVSLHNRPSLAMSRHAGSRRVGYVVLWQRPGRLLCWYSPGARKAGLRFRAPEESPRAEFTLL